MKRASIGSAILGGLFLVGVAMVGCRATDAPPERLPRRATSTPTVASPASTPSATPSPIATATPALAAGVCAFFDQFLTPPEPPAQVVVRPTTVSANEVVTVVVTGFIPDIRVDAIVARIAADIQSPALSQMVTDSSGNGRLEFVLPDVRAMVASPQRPCFGLHLGSSDRRVGVLVALEYR